MREKLRKVFLATACTVFGLCTFSNIQTFIPGTRAHRFLLLNDYLMMMLLPIFLAGIIFGRYPKVKTRSFTKSFLAALFLYHLFCTVGITRCIFGPGQLDQYSDDSRLIYKTTVIHGLKPQERIDLEVCEERERISFILFLYSIAVYILLPSSESPCSLPTEKSRVTDNQAIAKGAIDPENEVTFILLSLAVGYFLLECSWLPREGLFGPLAVSVVASHFLFILCGFLVFLIIPFGINRRRSLLGYTLMLFMLFTSASYLIKPIRTLMVLNSLTTEDVLSVKIDKRLITDRESVNKIIKALANVQCFVPNITGWSECKTMVLHMRSGQGIEMSYGNFSCRPGVILEFYSKNHVLGLHRYGLGFSRELWDVLKGLPSSPGIDHVEE